MFAILVVVFFLSDGSKQTMSEVVPAPPTAQLSAEACAKRANQYANDFHNRTDKAIVGVGFHCDILDDPAVKKTGA